MKKIGIAVLVLGLIFTGVFFYLKYNSPIKVGVIYYNAENFGPNEAPEIVEKIRDDLEEKVKVYYAGVSGPGQMEEIFALLKDKGVKFIIGPTTSSQALQMISYLVKYKMVAIAPKVTSPDVVGQSRYFYTMVPTDKVVAKKLAEKINRDGIEKLVIFGDMSNPTFINTFIDYFQEAYLGQVIATHKVEGMDFAPAYPDVTGADGVLMVTTPVQTGILAQKVMEANPDISMYASDYSNGLGLFQFGGKAIEGLEIIALFDYEYLTKEHQEVVNHLVSEGLSITQDTINYHDALKLLLAMIEEHGYNPGKVSEELKGSSFLGLGGRVYIDEKGYSFRNITLFRIEQGSFQAEATLEVK